VDWAGVTKAESLKNLARGFLVGILGTALSVEAFCTWLLVGVGGTAALVIANLERMKDAFALSDLTTLLVFLVLSALFGLLGRVAGLRIRIFLETERNVRESYLDVTQQHEAIEKKIQDMAQPEGFEIDTAVDYSPVMNELERAFPWYARRSARKNFEQGVADFLHGHIQATRAYFRMTIYVVFQLAFAIGFVVYAATSLRLSN
jgi:hypothetical protein